MLKMSHESAARLEANRGAAVSSSFPQLCK
jgi:hypothetical protein